jgi:dimethylglycine dehydrogenase
LTDAPLGNDSFRWLSGQEITVAGVPVRALRVNYVGELGWELHPLMNDLATLYDATWEAGQAFGIADFGLYAVNSLRIEKAYRGWGAELTNEVTMLDADMERFIKLDKEDFVGREATLKQRDEERDLQLIYFEVAAVDSDVRGGEPIFVGNDCVGVTTSGGFGHFTGKSLGFGYVHPRHAASGTSLQIGLLGDRLPAVVIDDPVHDPDNDRLRA